MTDPTQAKLRELLLNEFSEEELKSLCAGIGIDYDRLAGTGTFGKTRALIDTVRSQDKLRLLQARVRELRPAAYEAAGISNVSESVSPAPEPTSKQQSSTASRAFWPWLVLTAFVVVCLVGVLALLLPRLQGANTVVPANSTEIALASPTVNTEMPTETPPPIVEVTDALDKGSSEMTTTMATEAPPSTATVDSSTATPEANVMPATPAATVSVTVGTEAPATTATAAPNATPTDTHPSAIVINDLNAELPRFYRGEVDAQAIQQHWTGEALRSVVGFGTQRLPRAMRITPDQRNTIEATYAYRNGPTLLRETTNGAVVTSREFWRYATSANTTEFCETRDYVYELIRVDGQYKVNEFSSRIVGNGCE